jgi:hypothetical protein
MNNTFLIAFVVSFIFCIVKFVEMRYITKETYPLKVLVKESLFVFFSVIVGDFVIDQANPAIVLLDTAAKQQAIPEVFTTNPEF